MEISRKLYGIQGQTVAGEGFAREPLCRRQPTPNDPYITEIFLFFSMTTSHLERKRLVAREDLRRTDLVKPFCRRPDLVSPSVDYCCLECSMEEDDDEEDDEEEIVSTANNVQTKELLDKIRRAIDFTQRLHRRYARRMGRSVRPSEILSDRRRFWEIVYPWLPWDKHLQLNITTEMMTLNETMVRSKSGLRLLLSILQILKQAEFDRECQVTSRGFYRDLQHLEGNSNGYGLFQILCHLRVLGSRPSSLNDTSSFSTACTTPCREVTNATLFQIFQSVSLTKTVDLVLVTRVCLLDTIKFLFFLLRLVVRVV